jgi:predicted enzyme related to lactoylglutathione lyase
MPITDVLAGLAVADFDAALGWYERLFGRPADRRPMDGLAEWHWPAAGALQVIHDGERAGRGLLTVSADDLADLVATLEARGLAPGPIDVTTSDRVLIARISDPDGNAITLVQPRG